MNLSKKLSKPDAGKLFMIGLYGTELNNENMNVLKSIEPGAIIIFSRNVETPEKLWKFTNDISNFLGYKPIFAVDQEGGNVLRLKDGFSNLPSPMACAATNEPELFYKGVGAMAKEMKAVGLDWDLAPVVDVNRNPFNPVIGIRSFGDDLEKVIEFGNLFVSACEENGVKTCLKHFPGLGDVIIDPHYSLPLVDKSYERLFKEDIPAFTKIRSDSWMPTHVAFPKIQKEILPATLSKEMLRNMVRKELNYNGLLVADDLLMGGVSEVSIFDRLRLSFIGGMDLLTICHDPETQIRAFNKFYDWINESIIEDEEILERFNESYERVQNFKEKIDDIKVPLSVVNSREHREIMKEIYEKSVTLVNSKKIYFPIERLDLVLTMVNIPNSPVNENDLKNVPLVAKELSKLYNAEVKIITPKTHLDIYDLKDKNIIVITLDAYRDKKLSEFLIELDKISKLLLIALRNPYDAFLVDDSLASYGSLEGQQRALIDALVGKINIRGKLPIKRVSLENFESGVNL
ncbi:MAG: glycoside hydrolase family 3 N-terminal domain-containing protein [Fervidobacterium nodosum]